MGWLDGPGAVGSELVAAGVVVKSVAVVAAVVVDVGKTGVGWVMGVGVGI